MSDSTFETFQVDRDFRDVITVTFDLPDRSQNIFESQVISELNEFLDSVSIDSTAKMVVFCSGKKGGFFAGADIREIVAIETFEEAKEKSEVGQKLFQKIESLSIPTLAIIHGVCLGGGLEFALACSHRIAVEDSSTRIGLPETQLGILPAWGGTQRLPRTINLVSALQMILKGQLLSASEAKRTGLVDMIVSPDDLQPAVQKVIVILLENSKIPLSLPPKRTWLTWFMNKTSIGRSMVFSRTRKQIAKQVKHYPALAAAVDAIEAGLQKSNDVGYQMEQKSLGELIPSSTCQNLIAIFFQRERAKSGADWKHDGDNKLPTIVNLAVIGGGIMGAGIAQLAAKQGMKVVLKEINEEFADQARRKIESTLSRLVEKRRLAPEARNKMLSRITFCSDWAPLKEIQLAVEAVPEKMELKNSVFTQLEETMPRDSILASNTSALSIDEMQEAVGLPARMGGLHFFNPVHQMQLVEVVRGAKTSSETVSQLVKVAKQLGKVPIVTKNSPGFLVNRVLMPYLDEGVRLACEGYEVEKIDKEMRKFGMPMGPLELLDQVGLDVGAHVAASMKDVFGKESPTETVLSNLVAKKHLGKKSGQGFYEYSHGTAMEEADWKTGQPSELFTKRDADKKEPTLGADYSPIQSRLLLSLINESVRCLDEGVVEEPWMVDLGMVLGTGFAPFRGGPIRVVDDLGIKAVVDTLEELKESSGPRYEPAAGLMTRFESDVLFYENRGIGFDFEIV